MHVVIRLAGVARVWRVQRWKIIFESADERPVPTLRWAQYLPLGVSIVGEHQHPDPNRNAHRAVVKPHTVRSVTADRSGQSMTAVVCWLSDNVPPQADPNTLLNQKLNFNDHELRCTGVELLGQLTQRDLIGDMFGDVLLPDPTGSLADPVVEFRVRSVSPWLFAEKDLATEFHPGRFLKRLAHRWNDLLVWRPDSIPGSRPVGVPFSVPADVIAELHECTTAVSVSKRDPTTHQLSFDKERRKPQLGKCLDIDAVVRFTPGRWDSLIWFQALMRYAVWSGIGSRTTSGLGQVQIEQVRRLSDLPHAVVPQWQMW